MRRGVIILGSTGSIGVQALDLISRHREEFTVLALGAGGGNIELLARQCAEFQPRLVGVARNGAQLRVALSAHGVDIDVLDGDNAMSELAASWAEYMGDDCDEYAPDGVVILNGITGSVGLEPTINALRSGAQLALANKESLVVGGGLIKDAMCRPGQITPVDSEHSAIAQCLLSGVHHKGLTSPNQDGRSNVSRLILTASGGPFRGKKRSDLAGVTAQQALAHPTWAMGPMVTINSSTLMNKALELIEAAYLFAIDPHDILPVIHPQSVIHSMVEFIDGATIAQASPPNMELPIALGLSWPERLDTVIAPCSWDSPVGWTFEPVDNETFPALTLARHAVAASPLHPAVLNAANEVCVEAFLKSRIPYLSIVDTVAEVLDSFEAGSEVSLESVRAADAWARRQAHEILCK